MASKAKILKSIQHFDNVGKEIKRFEERIRDAIAEPDCSPALIDVLKSKIEKYEKKLEETFSELNLDVGDEKWEKYLDMQDSLLNCSVSLEKATVIDNSDLTEIDKLKYLFASVKGNAAKLIRGFAIKKENLKNCWELLCERYENKNQLANCQINKLFSIRTNKANSTKQLFEILDNCNESVRNLTILGLEINQLSELIIINHCTSKLHKEIAHRWELTLKPDTYPTLQAFRMFIESEARALGLLSGNADAPKSKLGTNLLEGMPIFGPAGTPTAIPNKLGYIFSGKIYAPPLKESIVNSSLNDQLSELWKLEEVPKTNAKIQIPDPCEESFSKSVKRNNEGRYIVNLPFKENNTLGESKEKAVQLLYALENKFHKNQQFKDNFLNFMNEYLALGHMREISQKRDDETPNCYIPYHMSFELQTITYGTSCAPFLALRTLQQLYQDEEQNFPLAAKIARENIYVDDLLSGADTEVEAKSIIIEIQNLLKSGGFILRKWSSSHPKVLQDLDTSLLASKPIHSLGDEKSKQRVLGLIWNLKTDSIQVKVVHEEIVKTKRQLLSVIAQIFDPLGLFSPSVITLKIMLQELWKSKALWDDPIPSSILENWNKFTKESKYLNSISIPRFMGINHNSDIILHGFCDASTKAYAAVVYLKSKQEIHLVSAKTRVAPIKQLTIPRLEHCGALLLAELISVIQKALRTKPAECFLWTDSTIVLSWLMKPPIKENFFVKNRITIILNLTSTDEWHHIPGKLNPADCATRGLSPQQLMNADYWWKGPDWINNDLKEELASAKILTTCTVEADSVLNSIPMVVKSNPLEPIISKFSNFTKVIRVIALCKRFINNCKSGSKVKGQLKSEEVESAHKFLVKTIQQAEYSQEISHLKYHKPIPRSSKLLSLNIFLD
ncbi:integrase catalytic domain-containing protein [Trichonephila clavipes]|nr:integrase catalytic domain-containing protein [Trichonephila clavipes]